MTPGRATASRSRFMAGARLQLLYGPPEDGVHERNILLAERLAGAG